MPGIFLLLVFGLLIYLADNLDGPAPCKALPPGLNACTFARAPDTGCLVKFLAVCGLNGFDFA